ncbi:hypothetical protein ACJ73_05778 [Blastomyces percursus]|uniref:Uncharacterized protein n=1 Tax=Blastomyces percursus TaxID=1658174 RepID=A0A1J9Q462_9EURO|nr:hypothetical protein ACJ73_05778 [Blastomyces percursus]
MYSGTNAYVFQEISNYLTSNTPIKTIGFSEYCEVNGRRFRRRKGVQQWTEVSPQRGFQENTESSPLLLSLVHQEQAPDKPLHWSLFIAREGQTDMVYQVKGDAEFMIYQASDWPVDITASASFFNLYKLNEQQAGIVKQIAEQESSPQAPSQQAVAENCQGWTVHVIAKLIERGIIENSKLEMARWMLQQVR